jgi:hypothetical protein
LVLFITVLNVILYHQGFFQKVWHIVGEDCMGAIKSFFMSGQLLKEANDTILTLVQKKPNPLVMGDFRPIAYCNVLYKCITKILATRMLPGLDDVISSNQTDFVPRQSILENVLLAQELIHDYRKAEGKPHCTIKIDLMKAYDFVSWDFILDLLSH